MGDVLKRHVKKFFTAVSDNLAKFAVNAEPATIEADVSHAQGRLLKSKAETLFILVTSGGIAFLFGDVGVDTDHAFGVAEGIVEDFAARLDPADLAMRRFENAPFGGKRPALECGLRRRFRAGPVFGNDQFQPLFVASL